MAKVIRTGLSRLQRTVLKERERALLAEQDRLRNILAGMPVILLAMDDAGKILFWNKESETVTGYSAAEMTGNSDAWELLIPDKDYREEVFAQRRPHRDFREMEVRLQTKGGQEVVVAFSGISKSVPIPGWDFWVTGIDVTERVIAQKQVNQQKEGFRQVLENMPVMLNAFDGDRVCLAWNLECERVTGYSAAEMIGKKAIDIVVPDTAYRMEMMALWDGDEKFREREWRFTTKSGEERLIEWSNMSRSHQTPEWTTWGVGVDVTDRHAAQQRVEAQMERFEQIIQNMPVMMNAFDDDMNCVMWNRECELVTGYSAEEMVGKRAIEIVVQDSAYRERMVQELSEAGDHRDWTWLFTTKSGEQRSIAWSNVARSHPFAGWTTWGVGVDVTDRVLAQEEVRTQGDRLQAIIDTLHEGLIIADASGKIVDINPVTVDLFGYDREQLIGKNLSVIMPDEMPRKHEDYLAAFSKTGKKKGRRLLGRNKNGDVFPIHLHVNEFERGGQKYFVGSAQDLTEIELMESRQRQSDKLVAVGRLASGIAHDFNNLLLPIITLTELMLSEETSDEKRIDRHEVVLAAAERGREVVEKFLAFSRAESLKAAVVDLPDMVDEVLGLLRESALATISFTPTAQPVPPVAANSGELHEVLVNLVLNAVDAVKDLEGEIHIEVDCVSSGDVGTPALPDRRLYVRLSVSDNGVGMDKEVQARMFDPFFTTKDVGEGSGLGLSVVHGIVERMQGVIDVSSKPGRGTIVTIYLPAMTTQ